MNADKFKAHPGKSFSLADHDPRDTGDYKNKKMAKAQLQNDIDQMADLQYKLYAENTRAILIIFQAMDSAGKDSAIRHIMSGINPQGCEVFSFKAPSAEELDHDYLWRHYSRLPERGRIGIFNRSHYENVLITKVHPELLLRENLPGIRSVDDVKKGFWEKRYRQINDFERNLAENGVTILKFFLHLSKKEQKKRFLERIEKADKHWKFSYADIRERAFWDDYQSAYEAAIKHTSTDHAPWYIVPADHKWFSRVLIGNIIVSTMEKMDIHIPEVTPEEKVLLEKGREALMEE
ncbi:MAG: polyphosphate kinase 2 family protein [Lewinellaceae bacterium]|nr:polyphosphate kinase 2 family protein [Lewinellaceae bacterium]